MSPSQSVGSVDVITRPVVVGQLFVDGTLRGATPVKLENLAAGAHRVRIVAQGYQPFERDVQVQANGSSTLNAELVAVPQPTQPAQPTPPAAVEPTPAPPTPPAQVAPENGNAPAQPTAAPTQVAPTPATTTTATTPTQPTIAEPPAAPPATRPATATTATARPTTATTTAATSPATTPVRTPTPTTAQTAGPPVRAGTGAATGPTSITISTQPWARIFIDGRDTGRNTPARDIPITPGRHVIRLVTADSRSLEEIVEIQPGEHARLVREIQ